MKVARRFNAWNRPKTGPSRRERCDGLTPIHRLNDAFVHAQKRSGAK